MLKDIKSAIILHCVPKYWSTILNIKILTHLCLKLIWAYIELIWITHLYYSNFNATIYFSINYCSFNNCPLWSIIFRTIHRLTCDDPVTIVICVHYICIEPVKINFGWHLYVFFSYRFLLKLILSQSVNVV